MTSEHIVIHGRSYLTLRAVAECYAVDVRYIEEVYSRGLLGAGVNADEGIAVEAAMLDRVARIVRLHRQQGLDLAAAAALLEWLED